MWHKVIQNGQDMLKNLSIKSRNYHFDEQILKLNKIISFIWPRRVGKTFLMLNMVQQLIKNEKITLEQVVFIDFTLYENGIIDPMLLLQEYYELFPDKQPFFVFDEIQEIANFKEFVLALFIQQHKIFLSGSNSRLLSSELSTQFRGRIYEFQVQPLVATEIFSFHTIPRKAHYSMLESAKINHLYQKVLHFGSFPEVVMIDDEFTKADLLKWYFDVLLFKDLVGRYHIENSIILKRLLKNLTLGFTKEININTTYKELKSQNIQASPATLYEYYDHIKSVFYGHEIENFFSPQGQKKFYLDNIGFHHLFSRSPDWGQSFENLIFWELKKKYDKVYFKKGQQEIDFYIEEANLNIQACYHLSQQDYLREIQPLKKSDWEKIIVYWEKENNLPPLEESSKIVDFFSFVKEYC